MDTFGSTINTDPKVPIQIYRLESKNRLSLENNVYHEKGIKMSSLEQRIQRLEDIESIKQLKAKYLHSCDSKVVDDIRSCFSAGEVCIDYGAIGKFNDRESFLDVFQALACNEHVADMHHGQNPQINWINEEKASATWDLYFYQVNTETKNLTQLAGSYLDEYEKKNGQWVIVKTLFTVNSTVISEIKDECLQVIFSGSKLPSA